MGQIKFLNTIDDDDEIDDLVGEDKWEDADFQESVNKKYPGWYLVKLPGFTTQKFEQVDEWLKDGNVVFGQCEPVGWASGCSYSVGVVFESGKDAMMFKLRWR